MKFDPEAYARHLQAWTQVMAARGGELVRDCVFRLDGVCYDLSASATDALDLIVAKGLSVVPS